jgi:ABC-type transport system involved in multi-copper enzyme maturation permease subunit
MSILGPVFWHDLVRIARRQRVTLWRVAYGGLLLAAILLLYIEELPQAGLFTGGFVKQREQMSSFANAFFAAFVAVQFAAVILFTPALAANAITEERSKNTLIFLFTTDLTNREIVAGKLLTRLVQIGMLVLTGLPVLALMQFFGGIDPNLVLASYLALALTGLSLACVGLVCGIRAKKPQQGAWRAYQVLLVYAALSTLMIWYYDLPFGRGMAWGWMTGPTGRPMMLPRLGFSPPASPDLWQTLIEGFNVGNPYFAYLRLQFEQSAGTPFADALLGVLRDFSIFHSVIALIFGGYAFARLRAVASSQTIGMKPAKHKYLKPAPHPPIRNRPVLWKEIYCESKPRQRWLALFFSRWFFFVSFLPAWIIFLFMLDDGFSRLTSYTVIFLKLAGTLVACLLCIRVGLQAARSIAAERERETLDSLLTTELRPGEIIAGKWCGAFLNCRWILVWLLVHWCLGVLAFAVAWYSVPLLFVEVLIFAAFTVSVGMLCAVKFPTTRQAMTVTLLVLILGTTIAPWIGCKVLGIAVGQPVVRAPSHPVYDFGGWFEELAVALSPPRALAESIVESEYGFRNGYYGSGGGNHEFLEFAPYLSWSLMCYSALAVILGLWAANAFRAQVRTGTERRNRSIPEAARDEGVAAAATVSA